jgi:hypothetical protein
MPDGTLGAENSEPSTPFDWMLAWVHELAWPLAAVIIGADLRRGLAALALGLMERRRDRV